MPEPDGRPGPGTRPRSRLRGGDQPRRAAEVLADRIAATLTGHEPGWRLPLPSALARRHSVGIAEVNAAVDELVSRQLVRRAASGQLYRASPVEYLIPLEGTARLGTRVDPMSGTLTCLNYGVSWRPPPEDAACALKIPAGEPVCVLQLAWALNGMPAAVTTTYLTRHLAHPRVPADWLAAAAGRGVLPLVLPGAGYLGNPGTRPDCMPYSAAVQMQLPPPSVARRLRLPTGQLAVLVTVMFGYGSGQWPAAMTAAVLRPDMFRIVVDTAPPGDQPSQPRAARPSRHTSKKSTAKTAVIRPPMSEDRP
ncbi:hypothetical protein [Trebonia sp.]|uniref:hypothetical protein n=1 Tax=Trebonia sp. TaxID=2767075 RepID=UPI00262743F7|nr:hypothetical protein [Trebonia sp.]